MTDEEKWRLLNSYSAIEEDFHGVLTLSQLVKVDPIDVESYLDIELGVMTADLDQSNS